MHIALLTDGFYPFTLGGIQKHSYHLAKSWAQQGVLVHVYHPNEYHAEVLKEHFTEEELKHIQFIYVQHPQSIKFPGHYIYNSYRYSKALYKQVGKQKYDAIYAQGFTGWYFLNHQKEINLITNLHGIEMYQPAINFSNKLQHLLLRIPAKPIIKKSNKQISLGGKLTNILYQQGAKPNSVFELPNAISEEWISSITPNTNTTRRFIFIGRYERRKGIEEINQVMTQLIQQNQGDFDMHFVGPIPKEKQIIGSSRQSNNLTTHQPNNLSNYPPNNLTTHQPNNQSNYPPNNLTTHQPNNLPHYPTNNLTPYPPNPQITYHGTITHQHTIQQLLLDSDILLCPSYSEGMPTVILEAMACGCAIIATDVGASGELVNDQNGWLIKDDIISGLKSAMQQALSIDESALQKMKENSIVKVKEKYTWEVVAKQTLEVCRM